MSIASGTKPKIIRAPAKAVVYCKNKADEGDDDEDNDNDDSEEEGEGQDGIMSMVKDLVRYEKQYRACISNSSEATFTEKYLASAIRRVLLKDAGEDLLYAMIDKPEKNGKKPDYMFGTKIKRREVYFFFVEVKRPEMKSKYQPEDDFTKLMKQMKGSVDDQLCLGSKNPTSLGLLVEGFKCTLFQMKLLADGIYMPMAFERFSLVEEIHQLVHLPAIVEALFFVKSELAKFIDEIRQPKTRAKTTTILGAISPYGVINVKVRKPRAVNQNKKRKAGGSTVTGHYFNFICDTMDVLDKHEEFKDCYIVMNNAPTHKNADIEKEINRRGYGCIYPPPYSPELNPIEQFWSVCKSKMKREELLQEETLSSRIHIPLQGLKIA
ncbi:hypothetical protein G6F40_011979 [Rhizopus arrhizus]|nr:hypothetical protein G6F40_011979 [Rhizopus arrhizus]